MSDRIDTVTTISHFESSAYRVVGKRLLDVGFASLALLCLAPVMAIIFLIIKLGEKGPALFKQERVGLNGRPFGCYKFRSMVLDADETLLEYLAQNPEARSEWDRSQKLTNDPRVTSFGLFLRKSSLDELPQLFNVLIGQMSIVGPRPILASETARYEDKLGYYLSVKPGLTGLWQVSGRSDCTYPERVNLDVRYVRELSLGTDAQILFKTIPAILKQRGSY